MSDYNHIKIEKSSGRYDIVLSSPPVNIITIAMMKEICGALEKASLDSTLKVIVFRSEGKHFSAGADVSEHTQDKVVEMIGSFGKMFRCMSRVAPVTIAAVDGSALGGGCELATFCDIVLASEKAKFGQPEILLGVFPPVAAVTFPILIGRNRAMELLVTGKIIDAREAERIGLINQVYSVDEFKAKTDEFIAQITSLSAAAVTITKKNIDYALFTHVIEAFRFSDRTYMEELMATEDAHEGLAAFLEKRKPVWKDK